MTIKLFTLSFFTTLFLATSTVGIGAVQAAPVDPFKEICKGYSANNPNAPAACKEKDLDGKNPLFGPDSILTAVINILSIVVGIVAVIGIMAAGMKFIISGDNPQEVSSARDRVIYAVIALILAASAQLIVRFILNKVG